MKKSSVVFLQIVVVAAGLGALAFLVLEPLSEGRNINATLYEVYFKDTFLMCVYLVSIAFFVGLYQAYRLLGLIGQNKTFTPDSVIALRKIKYCSVLVMSAFLFAEACLVIIRPEEDIAGGVFMGLLGIAIFGVIASLAKMFEKLLQNAIDIKSENDLTV